LEKSNTTVGDFAGPSMPGVKRKHDGNDGNRDAGGDQAVFDGGGSGLVLPQAPKHIQQNLPRDGQTPRSMNSRANAGAICAMQKLMSA
jgi:hypothetical protein